MHLYVYACLHDGLCFSSTCFYALCLISKTPQGANMLLSNGWTSVRHSREDKWPLILEETIEEIVSPPSPLSPSTSVDNSLSTRSQSFEKLLDSSPSLSPKKEIRRNSSGTLLDELNELGELTMTLYVTQNETKGHLLETATFL